MKEVGDGKHGRQQWCYWCYWGWKWRKQRSSFQVWFVHMNSLLFHVLFVLLSAAACTDKNCRKTTTCSNNLSETPPPPLLSDGLRQILLFRCIVRERKTQRERGELVTVATRRVTLRQWHMHGGGGVVGECRRQIRGRCQWVILPLFSPGRRNKRSCL